MRRDEETLRALREHGRLPFGRLREKTGLTKPRLSRALRGLIRDGVVRFHPPRGPGEHGAYTHVLQEALGQLLRHAWAERVLDAVGPPGPGLTEDEYAAAVAALKLRRDLPPVTRILDRVPVRRPKPGRPPKLTGVGVSPEEAEAVLREFALG
jgi:DNA-binding HxlR family transcriptional regulator